MDPTASPPRSQAMAVVVMVIVLAGACARGPSVPGENGSAPEPVAPTVTSSTAPSGPRSAPRWEPVTSFAGQGPATSAPFAIAGDAIQWRVRWSCATGRLRIDTEPAPARPGALVDEACPGEGEGYSIATGSLRLRVEATGDWTVAVEQQVDTPVAEVPVPGMADATVVAAGDVYGIERTGRGYATLHRLPDGSAFLRLEDFEVSPNTDLFVWLSEAVEPHTSVEASVPPYVQIAELKSTLGSQNYAVPDTVDLERVNSVVIWCAPVRIAYAAAPLVPT